MNNHVDSAERNWMERATELARHSEFEEGRTSIPPAVGVVAVRDGELIGETYRGAHSPGAHAEFGLLEGLQEDDLSGVTIYTTLEPCSTRNHPKIPCADRLAEAGVSEVVIGIYDPNPAIYRKGWSRLRDAAVVLRDFPADLRDQISEDNAEFLGQFTSARGRIGSATFDYQLSAGRFSLSPDDHSEFITCWTMAGKGSIHAVDYEHNVALARYAGEFDEIDDPGALDFSDYSQSVREGEIVVFRNHSGYALVRPEKVLSGPDYEDPHTQLTMSFELRQRQGRPWEG